MWYRCGMRTLASVLALCLVGCASNSGNSSATPGDASTVTRDAGSWADSAAVDDAGAQPLPDAGAVPESPLIAARPYTRRVPAAYDGTRAFPLILVLHGYGAAGAPQSLYLGMNRLADTHGILLAHPDGTTDAMGRRFWNASNACCDFYRRGIDDVAYLTAVLDDMEARFRVDPQRVFVVGHSNGGFMAHRLACAIPGRVKAIASLAGAAGMPNDYACEPSAPVHVLQIHGTSDGTVLYGGGSFPVSGAYPSAAMTTEMWAQRWGCGAFQDDPMRLDLDTGLAGADTTVSRATGCTRAGVELWTIANGAHIPALGSAFGDAVWAYFSRVTAR